jgi:hypothetical protein
LLIGPNLNTPTQFSIRGFYARSIDVSVRTVPYSRTLRDTKLDLSLMKVERAVTTSIILRDAFEAVVHSVSE